MDWKKLKPYAVVGVVAVALGSYWFFDRPHYPQKPFHMVREADGFRLSGDLPRRLDGGCQLGVASSASTMSGSSGQGDPTSGKRFACARIAVFNHSSAPLAQRVGVMLAEALKSFPPAQRIDYYPEGCAPPSGDEAPDIVVQVDCPSVQSLTLPLYAATQATITIHAATGLSSQALPLASYSSASTFTDSVFLFGYTSPGGKGKRVAEAVVRRAGAALKAALRERLDAMGELPPLPAAFYPPYEKTPALGLVREFNAQERSSLHGLLSPNETAWTFNSAGYFTVRNRCLMFSNEATWRKPIPDDVDKAIRAKAEKALKAEGWTVQKGMSLAAWRGDGTLRLFQEGFGYKIVYTKRMSEASVEAALAAVTSPEALLLFEPRLDKARKLHLLELLKPRPPQDLSGSLAAARLALALGDKAAARDFLACARVLALGMENAGAFTETMKKLVAELGTEPALSEAVFGKLGFVKLGAAPFAAEVTMPRGAPLRFYGHDSQKHLVTYTVKGLSTFPGVIKTVTSRDGRPDMSSSQDFPSGEILLCPWDEVDLALDVKPGKTPAELSVSIRTR